MCIPMSVMKVFEFGRYKIASIIGDETNKSVKTCEVQSDRRHGRFYSVEDYKKYNYAVVKNIHKHKRSH